MSKTVKKRLTKTVVDTLPINSMAWDTEVTGFLVRARNQAVTFLVTYRHQGRQRWYTITVTGYSTGGTSPHLNYSISQKSRPLLNPDEVSRAYARETGKALIFLDAIRPLQVTRVLHYRDGPFRTRADGPCSQDMTGKKR